MVFITDDWESDETLRQAFIVSWTENLRADPYSICFHGLLVFKSAKKEAIWQTEGRKASI